MAVLSLGFFGWSAALWGVTFSRLFMFVDGAFIIDLAESRLPVESCELSIFDLNTCLDKHHTGTFGRHAL